VQSGTGKNPGRVCAQVVLGSAVRSFGKRGGSASAFQLLDFCPKLLDHSVLIQNDLNQLLATE
jgi:hypothetical protein